MTCAGCPGHDRLFTSRQATRTLKAYRRRGPRGTTATLLGMLRPHAAGRALVDVGGGVGVLQHELQAAGAAKVTAVDGAAPHLQAAKAEAVRRGYEGDYHLEDFVAVAPDLEADIVTLDRVVCCYPDMPGLVDAAALVARQRVGLVFPRDRAVIRAGVLLGNAFLRLSRNPFRGFVHDPSTIRERLAAAGMRLESAAATSWWHVEVYVRRA